VYSGPTDAVVTNDEVVFDCSVILATDELDNSSSIVNDTVIAPAELVVVYAVQTTYSIVKYHAVTIFDK